MVGCSCGEEARLGAGVGEEAQKADWPMVAETQQVLARGSGWRRQSFACNSVGKGTVEKKR